MQTDNRYVRLGMLTFGLAVLFYLILFLIFGALHVDFPFGLQIMLAVLGASVVVYKLFSQRIF